LKKAVVELRSRWFTSLRLGKAATMMGPRQVARDALLYEFSIKAFVPSDHPPRAIDRFIDLSKVR
jgi:hypothetical protein